MLAKETMVTTNRLPHDWQIGCLVKRVQLANHSTGLCLHFWQVFLMMHDDWFGSGRPELREAASYGAPHEHLERENVHYFTLHKPISNANICLLPCQKS